MKFIVINLTPKTKFYAIDNGEIVAARFERAELHLENQYDFQGHRHLSCCLEGVMQLANGNKIDVRFTYCICSGSLLPRGEKIYATADDARTQKNYVEFTITHYEFVTLMHKFGYTPTLTDIKEYGGGHTKDYNLWYFDRESKHFGAHLTAIKKVDLFKGTITTNASDRPNDIFNTKAECEKANHVNVVEFDDEPTEDEQPTDNDFNVHIVFIEVVK